MIELMKDYILKRYNDMWDYIYENEKEEISILKKYIDYVSSNLQENFSMGISYDSCVKFLIKKHLDYVNEAFSSLLLGNYNGAACLMRIMIENYVSFVLIKKYKKEELWKDWYFFSYQKYLKKAESTTYCNETKALYKEICETCNYHYEFDTFQSYGWLRRQIKLGNYSFKRVCELVDKEIYKDFDYLSNFIHNNDMISKALWVDMTFLSRFLWTIFHYIDRIVRDYKWNIVRRKAYNDLYIRVSESLLECFRFKEFPDYKDEKKY